jgi:chromate transporter
MNAGVAAIVCDAALSFGKNIAKDKSLFSILIMLLSFAAIFFFNADVKLVIAVCALAGLLKMLLRKRRGESQ